jgi:hypothetical protein
MGVLLQQPSLSTQEQAGAHRTLQVDIILNYFLDKIRVPIIFLGLIPE